MISNYNKLMIILKILHYKNLYNLVNFDFLQSKQYVNIDE